MTRLAGFGRRQTAAVDEREKSDQADGSPRASGLERSAVLGG
jgi:hypothetical protein